MAGFALYHLTDFHTISEKSYSDAENIKCAHERSAVHDAVINHIIADNETDTVIISGDNTEHGRYEEHEEFLARVNRLVEAGKKVYCITATHDFGLTDVDKNGESVKTEGVALRSELAVMYKNLGPDKAIASFDDFNYIVKPCDGYRIFCLNDDGDGTLFRGYSSAQLEWITAQAKLCREAGDLAIATTHHPIISPNPAYRAMAPHEMLGNCDDMVDFFADNGIKFVFTGHAHMHSISKRISAKGNVFYEINTGTLREYPLKFRKIVFTDDHADVVTVPVPDVDFDTQGRTANQYYTDLFDELLLGSVYGMDKDYDYFVEQAERLNIKRDALMKLKVPLSLAGKVLNRITTGGVGRLLLCSRSVDASISGRRFKYLLAELLHNAYGGDEPFGPDTAEYKAIMAFLTRLEPVLKKVLKNKPFDEFLAFVESVIYDPTPDSADYLE